MPNVTSIPTARPVAVHSTDSSAGAVAAPQPRSGLARANVWLTRCIYSVFVVVLAGQWLFALYIAARYGSPLVSGDLQAINQGNHIGGYRPADTTYNFIYLGHILPVILLGLGGILQFVPQIRQRWPRLHRYNGRLFFTLAVSGAISGLYLTWGAGNRLSDLGALGITVNGLLIPLAICLAWRYAIARDIRAHKRWAVHSFWLVNGVWSVRLYLFGWYLLNQGPNGNTSQLDGPMDLFFSYACYLVPMAVAELVFWAQRQPSCRVIYAVAALLLLGSLVMLGGIVSIGLVAWLPAIRG